jgi:hypothetical protein
MNRRRFLKSSLALTSLAAMNPSPKSLAADATADAREVYELRRYQLRRGTMPARFDEFFRDVAVPAWNRSGVRPVAVFDESLGPDMPAKYVLLAHPSLAAWDSAREKFESDPAVRDAAFTNATALDPAYVRKESSLLRAFPSIPKLELPAQTATAAPRVFELRTYESHSRAANKKKAGMFDNGEIAIFRRVGLTPVFFGETLAGPKLPNLIYLLVFPDMAAREKAWGTFRADPEWKKLSATPGLTDPEIVTNIGNVLLKPTAYSQI